MVASNDQNEDQNKIVVSLPKPPSGGGHSSWAMAMFFGEHLASMSGRIESSSSWSEIAVVMLESEITFMTLNHLDIHGDDVGSSQRAIK